MLKDELSAPKGFSASSVPTTLRLVKLRACGFMALSWPKLLRKLWATGRVWSCAMVLWGSIPAKGRGAHKARC